MAISDFNLTKELLHEFFEYRNGELYWKITYASRKIGTKCGSIDINGYPYTMFKGKNRKNHRLIFLMFYGYIPELIDHIDGNKSNNKIENLRKSTKQENGFNSKLSKSNKSGVKGVSWSKDKKKWVVQLSVDGINKCFGRYNDIDYAIFVANAMRNKYHKDFARHK